MAGRSLRLKWDGCLVEAHGDLLHKESLFRILENLLELVGSLKHIRLDILVPIATHCRSTDQHASAFGLRSNMTCKAFDGDCGFVHCIIAKTLCVHVLHLEGLATQVHGVVIEILVEGTFNKS